MALFDIENDPFELNNLAFDRNYAPALEKIRQWAEAEIGRPPIAVVGGWNEAYVRMLRTIGVEGKGLVPFFWKSGRAIPYEICDTENICTTNILPVTGWLERGTIEYDFARLSKRIFTLEDQIRNGNSDTIHRSKRILERFWLWAKLCGNLCCPLLKRNEKEILKTKNQKQFLKNKKNNHSLQTDMEKLAAWSMLTIRLEVSSTTKKYTTTKFKTDWLTLIENKFIFESEIQY